MPSSDVIRVPAMVGFAGSNRLVDVHYSFILRFVWQRTQKAGDEADAVAQDR